MFEFLFLLFRQSDKNMPIKSKILDFIYFKFFKIHCNSSIFICKLCIASIFHLPQPPTVVITCRFTSEKFIFIRKHLKASSLALAVGFLSYAKQEDILWLCSQKNVKYLIISILHLKPTHFRSGNPHFLYPPPPLQK
jgi:hypothetical protein